MPLKIFVPHASEIWTKLYDSNYKKFWAFWQKKTCFFNHFWQSVDAILKDVSAAENNCLMINY